MNVLKIIVCVKQVPDMTNAKLDRKANTIIREGVTSIINPYDIHAVEEGLRIREKKGGSVIALSMGIPGAVRILKQIIAMGADRGILLTDRVFAGADTLATSYTLSKAIEKIRDFDIILCGKQTVDGDTAQVGPGLAEKLGVSHVTNVVEIMQLEEKYIICRRVVEKGWEIIKLPLPAVITVEKEINTPRFPNIKGIRNVKTPRIDVWCVDDIDIDCERIGLKGSPTKVVKTFIPESKIAAEVVKGTVDDQVNRLISILNELHIEINVN